MAIHDGPVASLYRQLLDAWNRRDARGFAALFSESAEVTGFDGSLMTGTREIESTLASIFKDHPTGRYVGIVRSVRAIASDVVVLRAVAGMVPAGADDLNPALNTIQTMVASLGGGASLIESYQNTPAAFHGRPELADALSRELRAALR